MTNQLILCPQCKLIGIKSSAYRVSFEPDKIDGRLISTFRCQLKGADHDFDMDQEGNVIDDGCHSCGE